MNKKSLSALGSIRISKKQIQIDTDTRAHTRMHTHPHTTEEHVLNPEFLKAMFRFMGCLFVLKTGTSG